MTQRIIPIYDGSRSFDATALTGSYQNVGSALESPAIGVVIYNTSDVDVNVSLDGGTHGIIIPAGGVMDASRFSQTTNSDDLGSIVMAKGTQIKIKQVTAAGTSGNIYFNVARTQ